MPWEPAFVTGRSGGWGMRPRPWTVTRPGWGGEPGHMTACLVITGLAIRDLDIFWMPARESGNVTANTGW